MTPGAPETTDRDDVLRVGGPTPDPTGPIVLVGTGRCGSTMLHRLLAHHEQLGWLSTLNEVFPGLPALSLFSRLYRLPLPERIKEMRAFPKPFEAYRFWEHYLTGFSRRDRPLSAADVEADLIPRIRAATSRILRGQGRDRLLVKVTGWSRITYFDRIYPGSRFISLRRDPRAVVSSWLRAGWLDVTSPPDSPEWQWGRVPPPYLNAWRELGGDALLSAALKIRLDLDDIAVNMAMLPGRCTEISYEDIITEPMPILRKACAFAELDWTSGFERTVRDSTFFDSTRKWRAHISEEDASRISEFMRLTGGHSESSWRISSTQR